MSKLSRYNLLISSIRSDLRYTHVLAESDSPEHNQLLYRRSVEAWIFLSDDLMCENSISLQGRDTRISNLIKLLNRTNTSLILLTLKKIYDILIDHISTKSVLIDYSDFKGRLNKDGQDILGILLSPIKECISCVLQSQTLLSRGCYRNFSTNAMKCCAQYLLFLSKINFEGVGLEELCLQDYLKFEQETSCFDFEICKDHLKPVQTIITNWMANWSYDGLSSKHGSGSVADSKCDKHHKYLSFAIDSKISFLYQNDIETLGTILPFGGMDRKLIRTSKLVFVPKNITKLRSISMEPTTLQYLQQGCMNSLYEYFAVDPTLKKILKLEDQTQNQSFAYHGSITDDYATIDLSHASDSINWNLVLYLFAGVPKLRRWLMCTRSTHTLLPTGESLELSKFAPMGSALCFPIESLIFAAISQHSINLTGKKIQDRDNVIGMRSNRKFLTVYGDDIILPSYAAKTCVSLLILFGFTPNEEKSYLQGPFKESCGGNYFCGFDITAVKFAPSFDSSFSYGVSPEAYSALCSYANLAYERGYTLLRLYFIKLLFESGNKPLFTDNLDEAPAIYSPNPTNFHLKKVYIKRYQKYQLIYTGTKTVEKIVNKSLEGTIDHIFLYDFLHQAGETTDNYQWYSTQGACENQGSIVFDTQIPYARSTLLPQSYKFTLCRKDYEHS